MIKFLKKVTCANCKKEFRKHQTINYAGVDICSEKCMVEHFQKFSIEELLEMDKKDREINGDFYRWVYGGKGKTVNR